MLLHVATLALLTIQGVYSQCLSDNDGEIPQSDTRDVLYNGQLTFTLNVFNAVNQAQPQENVFFSPFSIYHALLLGYFAAGNHTERSLKTALNLNPEQSKVGLMKSYKLEKFLNELTPPESYEFRSANRIYVDKLLPVKECMFELFQEEMEKLDFRNQSVLSRDYINQWVMNVTKNNIKDLIPPDGIDPSTKMVLVNAAYFKGVWTSRFDPDRTSKAVFYVSPEKQTMVTMMKQKGRFNYGMSEELGAHILEMPYKGDNVSMYVLLPPFADQQGIDKVLTRLSPKTLAEVVDEDSLYMRSVEVEFPKFTLEKSLPLKYVFELMGADSVFDADADFSTLTGEVGPHFSDATHKAKIRIDEQGTVAAAATAVFSFRSSRPVEQPKFICNHPFVYFLYDKPTKTITFMGVFRDPKDVQQDDKQ